MTLLRANILFVAANLLHTADHQRQGTAGLRWEILAGGSAITIAAIASLVLAWRKDERAPIFGAVLGLSAAAGIAASHLAPHWSAFSDSYPEIHADATSWVVVLLEIAGALLLAAVAVRELRRASNGAPRAAVVAGSGRST
ncbi:MAG: hypothetical protein E6G41_01730 [Actinobacteria bacterium]|nr:MAG: hypothetical protein E6G41_01730 [Actinomycetota bacterium]